MPTKGVAPVPGKDTRGLGLENFGGRGPAGAVRVIRVHKTPGISPDLWRLSTAKQKVEALASYKAELAAAEVPVEPERGPAAVANSGVPRLPRIDGPAETGPRRRRARKSRPRFTLAVSLASFPEKKWNLAPGQRKPWTPNGKNKDFANGPTL